MKRVVENEKSMESLGRRVASVCTQGALIFLQGDLGAGKTTLVRGLLRELGHDGRVKSPTYALIEEYRIGCRLVYHLDLYRLSAPEELEYLGIREFSGGLNLCLIEWPERGAQGLLEADLTIRIEYEGRARCVELIGNTSVGKKMVDLLAN